MSPARRFGNSVVSLPLWVRLVVTAPAAFVFVQLMRAFWTSVHEEDPRPAALALFLLGVVSVLATPFLISIWRSNPIWLRHRSEAAALERRLAEAITSDAEQAPPSEHFG